jgi:dienelactone hydrolase
MAMTRALRPALAAIVGLVAASAGAAIGFPYLTKAGWSVPTVVGMLAFSGGLLLFVAGVVAVVRMVQGWKRWLVLPVGLVVLYGIGFPLVVAVAATTVPRTPLGSRTPAAVGLAYMDVSLRTADGFALSAWYVPSRNRAAVVVVPGASSTRSAVLRQAAVVAGHGYGVLLVDPRGQGRSGGRAMNLGWYGDRDIAAALDWLQERPDVDPGRLGAVGASMGGEESLGALGSEPRLRAVVAEGATFRVAGDLSWLGHAYGLRGRFQVAVTWLSTAVTDLLTGAPRPSTLRAAVARAAPRPVLLIAAGAVEDEAKAAETIRRASPGTVTVWIAEGASHVGGLRAQPEEWERRVVGFLDGALASDGADGQTEVG